MKIFNNSFKFCTQGPNKHGAVMVAALIFITLSVLTVGGYLWVITKEANMVEMMNDSIKALYLAEAGMERAISELSQTSDWSAWEGLSNISLGEGNFTVIVEEIIDSDRIRISSTGAANNRERKLAAYVSKPIVFNWGILSNKEIEFNSFSYIDSYNSTLGEYGGDNVSWRGNIRTNEGDKEGGALALMLQSDSGVYGDVVIGPYGDLEKDIKMRSNTFIKGTREIADSVVDIPEILPPKELTYRGKIKMTGSSSSVISKSGRYESISLSDNASITIDKEVTLFVEKNFTIWGNSHIDILNNARVTVYLTDSFEIDYTAAINNKSKDPTLLTFYVSNKVGKIRFKSQTDFYGAIYAPRAYFVLSTSGSIYGAVVAGRVSLHPSSSMHYDEALADERNKPLSIDSWQEQYE